MSGSIMLAVDRSVRGNASMALLVDGQPVCPVFEHVHPEQGFDCALKAREILESTGIRPSAVTSYAVGLGPGSFSGIRSSLAFVHGMAMPYDAPVTGVSSAAAAALSDPGFNGAPGALIAVAGDARRGTAWVAVYERTASGVKEKIPMKVVPYAELETSVPEDVMLAAVDAASLLKYLPHMEKSGRLSPVPAVPSAFRVAMLAADPGSAHVVPPLPVYPHPAVQPPSAAF